MKPFTYDTAPQNDSVVVIGGGPSTQRYRNRILEYVRFHNSTVISANYNYDWIDVDYTYFTDKKFYIKQIRKITCPKIIVGQRVLNYIPKEEKQKRTYYKVGIHGCPNVYKQKQLVIPKNGVVRYKDLGTSGFSAVFVSIFFRPKTVLLVGYDGPTSDCKYKVKLDGTKIRYKDPVELVRKKKNYFLKTLLPFMNQQNIQMESFALDALWGVDKNKLGIEIL